MPESTKDRPSKSHEYLFLFSKSMRYFYDYQAITELAAYDGRKEMTMKGSPKYQQNMMPGEKQNTFLTSEHERWQENEDGEFVRNKRSVWTVPTASYSEAHFATYPPELIEPCILAGTSERGCCPVCGAPWKRVLKSNTHCTYHDHSDDLVKGQRMNHQELKSTGFYKNYKPPSFISWTPTCTHGAEPIPCVVLDPFNGSGTTGYVAIRNNRSYIGIDLKQEYLDLTNKRIAVIQPAIFQPV